MVKPVADNVRGPSSLPGGLNPETNTVSPTPPAVSPQSEPAVTLEKSRQRTGVENVPPMTLTIALGRAGGVSAKNPLDLAKVKATLVHGAEHVMTAALGIGSAHAAADDWVAQTTTAVECAVVRDGKTTAVHAKTRFKEGDAISTGPNGQMSVKFGDGSTLSMGPNTEIQLSRYSYDPTVYMGAYDAVLARGSITVRDANGVESHFPTVPANAQIDLSAPKRKQ